MIWNFVRDLVYLVEQIPANKKNALRKKINPSSNFTHHQYKFIVTAKNQTIKRKKKMMKNQRTSKNYNELLCCFFVYFVMFLGWWWLLHCEGSITGVGPTVLEWWENCNNILIFSEKWKQCIVVCMSMSNVCIKQN